MKITGVLLALLLAVTGSAGAAAQFQITGLTFDTGMLLSLVNTAQQTNGQITSFNAGPNAGVVSCIIKNTGTTADYCYFYPKVSQPNNAYGCSGNTLVTGPVLQTTTQIQPGQTLNANLNNFELCTSCSNSNGFNGSICPGFQNSFNTNSASSIESSLNGLLSMQLEICLQVSNTSGGANGGQGCTNAKVFTAPPANTTTCPAIIYPHDNPVPLQNPNFAWTPAFYNGSSAGIQYTLVISETEAGDPWYQVDVPQGQTYYQYTANDRQLVAGKKYYFHVISKLANGSNKPIGGQNGQGWNTQKWFDVEASLAAINSGVGVVTLSELDAFVRGHASPKVQEAIKNMVLQGVTPANALSDQNTANLLANPGKVKSFEVDNN